LRNNFSTILGYVALVAVTAAPSYASSVATDGTWYNFKTAVGVDYGAGIGFASNHTSASGFYSDPGTAPWTFTATGAGVNLTVVDGGEAGDIYYVWDFGILVGSTSFADATNPGSYSCGDFPEPCYADPMISKGVFPLAPGPHSITISVRSSPYPNSTLSWFRVTSASGCDYTVGPGTGTTVVAAGGAGSLNVNTSSQCSWVATSSTNWLTITGAASGVGAGTVQFLAAANLGGARSANIDVSGKSYTVTQAAGSTNVTPGNALVLSQFVGGGTEWSTTLFLTNLSNLPETFTLRFYDDAGIPATLPIETLGMVDSITGTLGPGQTRLYATGTSPNQQAVWALLIPSTPSTARLSGLAVFRHTIPSGTSTSSSEAVVDFVGINSSKYVMIFDDAAGFVTAAALTNPDPLTSMTIGVDIRDEQGVLLESKTITLPPLGHKAFVVTERYPVTIGRRGSIHFNAGPQGLAGLGLRFSPFGGFTSFRLMTSNDIQ